MIYMIIGSCVVMILTFDSGVNYCNDWWICSGVSLSDYVLHDMYGHMHVAGD